MSWSNIEQKVRFLRNGLTGSENASDGQDYHDRRQLKLAVTVETINNHMFTAHQQKNHVNVDNEKRTAGLMDCIIAVKRFTIEAPAKLSLSWLPLRPHTSS